MGVKNRTYDKLFKSKFAPFLLYFPDLTISYVASPYIWTNSSRCFCCRILDYMMCLWTVHEYFPIFCLISEALTCL